VGLFYQFRPSHESSRLERTITPRRVCTVAAEFSAVVGTLAFSAVPFPTSCIVCEETCVIFGHCNRSFYSHIFYLLTYLLQPLVVCYVTAQSTTPSSIARLTGGISPRDGHVEIFFNGRWGTICDDGWTILEAAVACRMLGYTYVTLTRSTSTFQLVSRLYGFLLFFGLRRYRLCLTNV